MNLSWFKYKTRNRICNLADSAQLTYDEKSSRADLIETLAKHLDANKSRHSKNADFLGYYGCIEEEPEPRNKTIVGYNRMVIAFQTVVLLYELTGLIRNALQPSLMAPLPVAASKCTRSHYPQILDSWKFAVENLWAPTALWSLTSWMLPLAVSYFFIFTLRSNIDRDLSYSVSTGDPLTFSIAKAIIICAMYTLPATDKAGVGELSTNEIFGSSWRLFFRRIVESVCRNVPEGYWGFQIRSFIGVLVSLCGTALENWAPVFERNKPLQ